MNPESPRHRNGLAAFMAIAAAASLTGLGFALAVADKPAIAVLLTGFGVCFVLWIVAARAKGKHEGWPQALLCGAVLGAIASLLLAREFAGKSFAGFTVDLVRATPQPVLIVPIALGLITAAVAGALGVTSELAGGVAFLVGSLVGAVGGAVVDWLSPLTGHGTAMHIVAGVLLGGAMGTVTPWIAARLRRG